MCMDKVSGFKMISNLTEDMLHFSIVGHFSIIGIYSNNKNAARIF